MAEQRHHYQVLHPANLDEMTNQVNQLLNLLADRMDQLEGYRGTPTFRADIDMTGKRGTNAAAAIEVTDFLTASQVLNIYEEKANKAVAGGYASLGATGKVPAAQLLVTEDEISLSDVNTNDVSITKHGFTPRAPNDTSKFLRGDGTWDIPGGTSSQEIVEDWVGAMVTGNVETGIAVTYDDGGGKLDFDAQTAGDARYPQLVNPSVVDNFVSFTNITGGQKDSGSKAADFAVAAKGVTGGDSHDHAGGDGAQIDHGGLGGLADDDHTQYIRHALATVANDFLVASGAGVFVKKTLAETLTILGKAAASGLASLDASTVVVEAINRLLAGTGALTTNDGQVQWQSTRKIGLVYDTQRERAISEIGWLPYAYQLGGGPGDIVVTPFSLAAQWDCVACPVVLEAPMLLESVTIRQTDVALQRYWCWRVYEQYLNNGNAAENTLTRVAYGPNTAFTPVAASNETTAATGGPTYLPPGGYWLVIQNGFATRALNLGTQVAGTMALNTAQTKSLGALAGTTLDFVAAAWAKQTMIVGARLNGRVFGETTSF